jgi:hypothetical protein
MQLNENTMKNIYNSKKLPELQKICETIGIESKTDSNKTGKKINKKKYELVDEIVIFKLNEEEKQNSNEKKDHEKTIASFDKDNVFYDEISTPVFLVWTSRPVPTDLKPESIEKKYDITLNFGCILKFGTTNGYYGDNFFIVGHNKEIIELDLTDHNESMNEIQYVVIPRQISKYLKDIFSFFDISKRSIYSTKLRTIKKDSYEYDINNSHVQELFEIGEIELENHDVYLKKNFKNIPEESNIQFKCILDMRGSYDYVLHSLIPYLGTDNSVLKDISQEIEGEIGIVETDDFNKLFEIQEQMKTTKITYQLFKSGPIEGDEDIEWTDDVEVISIEKKQQDNDINYDATVKMTKYQYIKTSKQIREHFGERMKAKDHTRVLFSHGGLKQKEDISFFKKDVFTEVY